MKKNLLMKVTALTFFAVLQLLTSCNSEGYDENVKETELSKINTRSLTDSLSKDTIIQFKELNNQKKILTKSLANDNDNLYNQLYDIRELPIYISVKENPRGGHFLTTQGIGKEIILADYQNNDKQKFYIKILPASTGIPYLIYSYSDNMPICVGQYSSAPNTKILFTLNTNKSSSLWGASWDFDKGGNTQQSFVVKNQDVMAGGPNYWDMYNLVIGANVNKIELAKYAKLATQEFDIMPVEDFSIQSIEYVNDATATLSHAPYKIIRDGYVNDSNIQQSYTLQISEEIQETSSHNQQTSVSATITTEFKGGIPIFAVGKISTSITSSTQFSYGTSKSVKRTISHSYPVTIPSRSKAEIEVTLFDDTIDMNYIATCKGNTSGRTIKIAGRWQGVSVSESDAVLHITSIDNPSKVQSYRIGKNMTLLKLQ